MRERYVDFWDRLSFDPELDGVDATGLTAVVPMAMLALGAWGMALALARRRVALVGFGLLVIALLPFGSALTVDGAMRRTFAMAPFLAMFCAIGVIETLHLVRWAGKRYSFDDRMVVWGVAPVLAGISVFIAGQNIYNYFWSFRDAPSQEWVFVTEFTKSVSYIHAHDNGVYVYYLSDRWSFNYEPRQFVAPEAQGEDRSAEFGHLDITVDPAKPTPLFLLVGSYRQMLPDLQARYPGGGVDAGGPPANPDFVAYWPTR